MVGAIGMWTTKHMTQDEINFITWNLVDEGNVSFGNNALGKIIAKGRLNHMINIYLLRS